VSGSPAAGSAPPWTGYSVGTKVLEAVLPKHDGPTALVPVEMGDVGLEERDAIEAKTVVPSGRTG
jgi:hypothetical protein